MTTPSVEDLIERSSKVVALLRRFGDVDGAFALSHVVWPEEEGGMPPLEVIEIAVGNRLGKRKPQGRRSLLTEEMIQRAWERYRSGLSLPEVVRPYWRAWGYASEISAIGSIARAFRVRGGKLRATGDAFDLLRLPRCGAPTATGACKRFRRRGGYCAQHDHPVSAVAA